MGRIVDLCGEIAAEADEGPEGLVLPAEAWDRLRKDWPEDDIEDAMGLVRDSLLQSELVDAADSLSARMVEILGAYGERSAFTKAEAGEAPISIDIIGQLARRVERLEEILEIYREGTPPDRRGFDALKRRLIDRGIEAEMQNPGPETGEDEDGN
jgi:hypothetical protein